MLFQIIDDKKHCLGIYHDNNFTYKNIPNNISKTWSYNPALKSKNIEYASLYVNDATLEQTCPDFLKQDFQRINNNIKAHISAIKESKISLEDNCLFELIPENSLKQFCILKNNICQYVFDNVEKPKEYNFFKRFTELTHDIKNKELNIELESLKSKLADEKTLIFYRKMLETSKKIDYNIFGSITGRLTTAKNSFPIQTFPSSYREILKPVNDWFVSFDVNAAELRTSLGLLGKQQPENDLYEHINEQVFNNSFNRTEIKKITTSWLYNSTNPIGIQYSKELEHYFNKTNLKKKYWNGKTVNTPFSRNIESDDYHAISHLNQSTFIDLFHRQIIKVDDYLKNCESFISFLLHDEFVVDMKENEKNNIIDIIKILENTQFGKFLINVKVGKNFGNMKKLKIKA